MTKIEIGLASTVVRHYFAIFNKNTKYLTMKTIITISILCFGAIAMMAQTPALKVASSGNVGVGIEHPSQSLEIKGNFQMQNNQYFVSRRQDGSPHTVFGQDFFNDFVFNVSSVVSGTPSSTILGFGGEGKILDIRYNSGNGQENFMRVVPNGNIGIGTTSPAALLHVNGAIHNAGGLITSDKRLKTNISPFNYGLSEVLQISPKFFEYNGKAAIKNNNLQVGIMAQDMQKIVPEVVKEWEYIEHDIENQNKILSQETYLAVQTDAIQYMLVNAIKEQQAMIKEQESKISDLETLVTKLLDSASKFSVEGELQSSVRSKLYQNIPNPFHGETSIAFSLADNVTSAELIIFDVTGKQIKRIPISERGEGRVNLETSELASGTYNYSLVADGQIISSNKMIKAN